MAAYSPFLSCGVGGRAASLYALLTRFRAPDHPSHVSRLRGRLWAVQCVWRGCLRVAACCRVLAALLRRLFRSRSALTRVFVVGVDGSGEREL